MVHAHTDREVNISEQAVVEAVAVGTTGYCSYLVSMTCFVRSHSSRDVK